MDAIRRRIPGVGKPLNHLTSAAHGPEAYISGDLCRSVFDKGRKMSPVERLENFGQAVLLLGVIDVGLGQDAEDSGSLFCSIVPLNVRGLPIEREKKMTKAVPVRHAYASFDEVFAFGRLCDLDAIHALKIKVRRYVSAFKSERVGVCTISVAEGLEDAPGSSEGLWSADVVCKIASVSGALRLSLLRHKAPAEPQPAAVVVRVVEGRGLLPPACDAGAEGAEGAPATPSASFVVRVRAVLYGDADEGPEGDAASTTLSTSWRPGVDPQWQSDKQLVLHSPGYDAAAIAATSAGEALPEPARGSRAESLLDDLLHIGSSASFDGTGPAAPASIPSASAKDVAPATGLSARAVGARPPAGSFDNAAAGGAGAELPSSAASSRSKRPSTIPAMLNEFFLTRRPPPGVLLTSSSPAALLPSAGGALGGGRSPHHSIESPLKGATASQASASPPDSGASATARRGAPDDPEAGAAATAPRRQRATAVPALFSRLQQDLQELLSSRRAQAPLAGASARATGSTGTHHGVDATRTRLACNMSRVRSLEFTVFSRSGAASASSGVLCGRVVVPLSSLWGDEDSVLSQHELYIERWFRLASADAGDADPQEPSQSAGHLRLHIRLKCREQLLPPGWVEAFDCDSGTSYYFNTVTCTSQWDEPMAIFLSRTGKASAAAAAPAVTPVMVVEQATPAGKPARRIAEPSSAEGSAQSASPISGSLEAAAASESPLTESPAESRRSRVARMTRVSLVPLTQLIDVSALLASPDATLLQEEGDAAQPVDDSAAPQSAEVDRNASRPSEHSAAPALPLPLLGPGPSSTSPADSKAGAMETPDRVAQVSLSDGVREHAAPPLSGGVAAAAPPPAAQEPPVAPPPPQRPATVALHPVAPPPPPPRQPALASPPVPVPAASPAAVPSPAVARVTPVVAERAAPPLPSLPEDDAPEQPDSSDDEETPAPEPASAEVALGPARGPEVPEFENPLASPSGGAALASADDRAKAFFGQLKSKADVKKLESEAVQQRKLAAMTPEERLAFATEQTNAQRREERKSRMLHTHLAGYSGAKPLSLASGRKSIAAKTSATRGATAGGASASGSAIGIAGKR